MARKTLIVAFLAIAAYAFFLHNASAQKVHVVGDDMGWMVPPGGPIAYDTWASLQYFTVGDILVFNFRNGEQDVAQVTKEAYKTCNSTNPIALKKDSPANFTLDSVGDYYFISTLDRHCLLGQKLAISVSAPGPEPSPSPRGPLTYTVGDKLGWIVPPAGEIAYEAWADGKTFIVGDTLVFNYINGTQDVAVVTKEAYDKCDTNDTIAVYSISPTNIALNTTGEHFFTSTYAHHCDLGQKLAINVTANGSSIAPSPAPNGLLPSAFGPSGQAPSAPPPDNSAPPNAVYGYLATLLAVAVACLY